MQLTEQKVVKLLQAYACRNEISDLKPGKVTSNKTLHPLNSFLDSNVMLDVGGRLKNAVVLYSHKYLLLFLSEDHTVRLLLNREHTRLSRGLSEHTVQFSNKLLAP